MEQEAGCQLFLVVEAGESAPDRLAAALEVVPIASVLIVPPAGQCLAEASAKPLVEQAQAQGAAALVLDDVDLTRKLRADGVHLQHSKDIESRYRAARQALGRGAIIGVHAGKSRHDAMVVAEEGAEYVAFGLPEGVTDSASARERRLDLVAWWAEIFEVPCVALDVAKPEDAAELARAGADFIGLTLRAGEPLSNIEQRMRAMAEAAQSALAE
jgi:thiamine-phosphate pyrophosphorylase